jgi:ABC-type Fe3+-hydroxamate transport system substrate-binding protein
MIIRVTDDRKRELTFGAPPKRIVSLVPSDTYSVAALGCGAALVGRTDYCELPADVVAAVPSVGGTKNPDIAKIAALEPDLIIANQEENSKGDLEALAQQGFKVLVCFPKRAAEGIAHLARLARVLRVEGDPAVRQMLKQGYEAIREAERSAKKPLRTFCPIWMKPLMTINGDTFISDIMALSGAENVFAHRARRYPLAADLGRATAMTGEAVEGRDVRYPRVTMEEVVVCAPELVLLPDEPHPFTEGEAAVFRAEKIPAAERHAVVSTSGRDLCWYGAHTIEGLPRMRALVDSHR